MRAKMRARPNGDNGASNHRKQEGEQTPHTKSPSHDDLVPKKGKMRWLKSERKWVINVKDRATPVERQRKLNPFQFDI